MAKILPAMLAAICAVFIVSVGGQIEGHFAPVSGQTQFDRIEPVGETSVRIAGQSMKLRECKFVRIEIRTGRGTVAPIQFEEGTVDRGAGRFGFGPWLVQLTPQQLQGARAIVYHRCHPLWLTETRWYP